VFNSGFERLIGTFDAQTMERELRGDPNWQPAEVDQNDANGRGDIDARVRDREGRDGAGETANGDGDGQQETRGARRSRKKKQGLRRRVPAAGRNDANDFLWEGAEEAQWEEWPEAYLGHDGIVGAVDAD